VPKVEVSHKGIRIDGRLVPIVSPDEAEEADAVVCASPDTPTPWRDNVHALCAWCQAPVIHRPHVPKKPPKICISCALASRQ
jgi:hypothetical protein